MSFLDSLADIEKKYHELSEALAVSKGGNDYQGKMKQLSNLGLIVEKYNDYKKVAGDIAGSSGLLNSGDNEIKELARQEIKELEEKKSALEKEIKLLLVPRDPNDDKNIIVEID